MNTNMKPRTVIGVIFVVASLLKLATLWGVLHWSWFETMSEGPHGPCISVSSYYYMWVYI